MIVSVVMVLCLLVLLVVAIVVALRQEAANKIKETIDDRNNEQNQKRDAILRSPISVNDALARLYKRSRRQ